MLQKHLIYIQVSDLYELLSNILQFRSNCSLLFTYLVLNFYSCTNKLEKILKWSLSAKTLLNDSLNLSVTTFLDLNLPFLKFKFISWENECFKDYFSLQLKKE